MAIDQQQPPVVTGPVMYPPQYGWAPPPAPWNGFGGYAAPKPEPPRRRRWLMPVAALGAAAVLAVAGGTAVAAVSSTGTPQAAAAQLNNGSSATGGGGYSGYPFGGRSGSGSSSNSGNGAAAGSGAPAATAITSAVDPTIVDINTTLGLQSAAAAGTGIVLTSTGEVLTNNHVINGATSITATDVGTGQTYQAVVVGYDRTRDLAVIQLRGASGLPTASIGDSSTVAAGASITAIGNAGGTGGTPSAVTGTVTAIGQSITATDEDGSNAEQLIGLIQIAAAIEPGDSGGPLVDGNGHVVGMDTAADNTGEGFAIPINQATTVAAQIVAGKGSSTVHIGETAFLGIAVASSSTGTGSGSGPGSGSGTGSGAGSGSGSPGGATSTGSGVPVSDVVSGSPAEQAGIAAGDTLLTLNGTTVTPTSLTELLTSHHPGDKVTLTVADSTGATRTVTLTLTTGPAA